jgi:hypothetical protein
MAKKTSIGSLLLAGAAAYGLYKLSKMSTEERSDLVEKGKHLVADQWGNLKQTLGRNGSSPDAHQRNMSGDVTFGG